jgi:hypothetical protein
MKWFMVSMALLVLCGVGGQAHATVVNFDNLSYNTALTGANSHYAGLTWEMGNAGYNGNTGYWMTPSSGSEYPHSLPHNIINAWGSTLTGIGFPQQVNVAGAYFAAQGSAGSSTTGVRIHGYRGGSEIAVTDWFSAISTTPAWFAMNLTAVDRIVVQSVPVDSGGGWYGMDDLTYAPTPEPSTLVLLGIGAISLLAYAWRRRTAARA